MIDWDGGVVLGVDNVAWVASRASMMRPKSCNARPSPWPTALRLNVVGIMGIDYMGILGMMFHLATHDEMIEKADG